MPSKHVLVTGGAGFVGSHLVDRLLALGHSVTVLDNLSTGSRANLDARARLEEGDIRNHDLLAELIGEADACFHLAAIASVQQCNQSWLESHAVNQTAFVSLLESVAERKGGTIPVVYASSAAVYGDTTVLPVQENTPLRPISVYGADKAGCENHARAAGRNGGVPSFGLRPFNIYGPRQNPSSPYSGVISLFADKLKRDETLTIYGDGKQTRDFIHINDIVSFLIAAWANASTEAPVCNAATGKETTVLGVAHTLEKIVGKQAKIVYAPARSGDITRSVADIAKAKNLLNITAKIEINEGLRFVLDT